MFRYRFALGPPCFGLGDLTFWSTLPSSKTRNFCQNEFTQNVSVFYYRETPRVLTKQHIQWYLGTFLSCNNMKEK